MENITGFIKRLTAARNMTVQELTALLGYKSKTSIDRILSGSAGAEALTVFETRLVNALGMTDEEKTELAYLIDCGIHGEDRAAAFRELHKLLTHSTACGYADFIVSSSDEDEITLSEYIKRRGIRRVKIYNCVYTAFFDVIRTLLRDTDAVIEQFIAPVDSEAGLVRVLCGIVDLMPYPNYSAFSYEPGRGINTGVPRGILLVDLIVLENAASEQPAFIVPDKICHGHITRIAGRGIQLPDARQYEPLNRTCPAAGSVNDFIAFCGMLADMERGCATYDLKPDVCVMYIPYSVLYNAYMSSPLPPEFHIKAVIDSMRPLFESRVANTYSKHKPTLSIMSEDALRKFARTGMTSDHMPGLRAFSVEERIAVFEQLLNAGKTNPWFELYLRKDNTLADYNICCYADRGLYMALNDSKYLTEYSPEVMLTPPESFYKLFESYYREELIRCHCYTAAESQEKIAEIIESLRGISEA